MGRAAKPRKLCTTFEVSPKWLKKYRHDARHLKTGWHEKLIETLGDPDHKPKKIYCSLSVGTNFWNAAQTYWTAIFNCCNKECGRKYFFRVCLAEKHGDAPFTVNVKCKCAGFFVVSAYREP